MVPERLRPVLDIANELARLFDDAGARLYLVGGAVRDALLDQLNPDGDLDFTTDALPEVTEQVLSLLGGQHLDTGQTVRHHRRRQRRPSGRGHHPPC